MCECGAHFFSSFVHFVIQYSVLSASGPPLFVVTVVDFGFCKRLYVHVMVKCLTITFYFAMCNDLFAMQSVFSPPAPDEMLILDTRVRETNVFMA